MDKIKNTLQSVTESRERKLTLFDKAVHFFLLDVADAVGKEIDLLDQEIEELKERLNHEN